MEVQQFPFRESDDDGDDIIGSRAAESVQDGGGSVGSRASRGAQHGQGAALSTADLYSRSHPPAQHNTPTLLFTGTASNQSSTYGVGTNNSRAVLSALRALQDRIRNLEGERSQYAKQCSKLEESLQEYRNQIGDEKKRVEEEHSKRHRELSLASKQTHELEVSAARSEEREVAMKKELDQKSHVLEKVEKDHGALVEKFRSETTRLTTKLEEAARDFTAQLIKKDASLESERAQRHALEIKVADANEFIAQCVDLNEKLVEENKNIVQKNSKLAEQLVRLERDLIKARNPPGPAPEPGRRNKLGTGRPRRSKRTGRAKPSTRRKGRAKRLDRPTASSARRSVKNSPEADRDGDTSNHD